MRSELSWNTLLAALNSVDNANKSEPLFSMKTSSWSYRECWKVFLLYFTDLNVQHMGRKCLCSPFGCFLVVWSFMNSFTIVRPSPSISTLWEQVCTLVHDQAGALCNSSPDHNSAGLGNSVFVETALATWYFGKLVFWEKKGKAKDP